MQTGGVNIPNPSTVFIGEDVLLDTSHPEDITLEDNVGLTAGVKIVTHYFHPGDHHYTRGKVHICERAYLGMNVLVIKPVRIGVNSVVGAGSVVTKDIPDGEVWAGNPARFICKAETKEKR